MSSQIISLNGAARTSIHSTSTCFRDADQNTFFPWLRLSLIISHSSLFNFFFFWEGGVTFHKVIFSVKDWNIILIWFLFCCASGDWKVRQDVNWCHVINISGHVINISVTTFFIREKSAAGTWVQTLFIAFKSYSLTCLEEWGHYWRFY